MQYIIGKYGYWLLAVSCWLLTACSSSDSSDEQRNGSSLTILPYAATYHDVGISQRAMSAGFSSFTPAHDLSFGLFVVPETGPTDGYNYTTVHPFRYSSGAWHSQTQVSNGTNYNIYGYMPMQSPITVSVNPLSGGSIQMVFTNIDGVVADDVCFVTGVSNAADNLHQGSFGYTGQVDNNYVYLLMDHLFASVNFKFTLDHEYSQLRSIKLKSLTLKSTVEIVNAKVTLTPNTTDTNPVSAAVEYTKADGTSSTKFFESALGEELNATVISSYACSFAPIAGNRLTLVSTYDVYDRHGNLIRENCTATNELPVLNETRGQRVTFNMKVIPTYLYMLSEPDLDNPTVRVDS